MTQPCDVLPSETLPVVAHWWTSPGIWAWIGIWTAIAVFELWAIGSGHETMTQTLRRAPGWFQVMVGCAFGILLWHLFRQGR